MADLEGNNEVNTPFELCISTSEIVYYFIEFD